MKLIRFGTIGNEKPGVQLQDGTRIDVSKFTNDYDEFFLVQKGYNLFKNGLKKIRKIAQ